MVCERNSCAGGYGNCLDVKITNACNANCAFCIEKGGYCPEPVDVKALALTTINDKSDTVLILGGEPTLYPHLSEYLQLIRPWKKKIYLTTNGRKIACNPRYVHSIASYLDGVNISIHHYTEKGNCAAYGIEPFDIPFWGLREGIKVFRYHSVPVRFNTNLIKGQLDTKADVEQMIQFAADMGADEIRFSELQNCEDLWVDAREVFSGLTDDPFHCGCEQTIPHDRIKVRVKMTCGHVNKLKPPVGEVPERTGRETHVLYPNGEITHGWLSGNKQDTTKKPSAKKRAAKKTTMADSWVSCHGSNGCH